MQLVRIMLLVHIRRLVRKQPEGLKTSNCAGVYHAAGARAF